MTRKLVSILKREGLEHLVGVFLEQGVTDSILADLSDNDLIEIGIRKLGERKRLLAAFSAAAHQLVSILKQEGLEHLAPVLLDQGVTDSLLADLTDRGLRELGIEKLGERKRLLASIAADCEVQSEQGVMVEVEAGVLPDGSKVGAFAISKFAVTIEEWRLVRDWGLNRGFDLSIGQRGKEKHPITEISWYDAVKWCNAKSELDGLSVAYTVAGEPYRSGNSNDVTFDRKAHGYRLPTESEWEWAARGGIKSRGYEYAGGDDLSAVGWFKDNSGLISHQVGLKIPNEIGLYDMSGNVWEWCWDWYVKGGSRVARGGSYGEHAKRCDVSFRRNYMPEKIYRNHGFRMARRSGS